jgi:hypothetical protein
MDEGFAELATALTKIAEAIDKLTYAITNEPIVVEILEVVDVNVKKGD